MVAVGAVFGAAWVAGAAAAEAAVARAEEPTPPEREEEEVERAEEAELDAERAEDVVVELRNDLPPTRPPELAASAWARAEARALLRM